MLKPTDPTGLRPLTPVQTPAAAKPVGDAREESFTRLNQIAIGKEYKATVLARMQDGQYLVRIGNAAARMPLPTGTQAGDHLSLTLISHQPRPTFLLNNGQGTSGTPISVSDAARLIDHMRQLAQREGLPARVLGGSPLLQTAPATGNGLAQQLTQALQNMLDTSGLFYESHVSEWATNQRPLSKLMQEPQASLQRPGSDVTVQKLVAEPNNAAGKSPSAAGWTEELAASAQEADTMLRLSAQDNPQAARLVNLQLEMLEHRRATWEGELWPGQKLVWEVSDETPEHAAGESGDSAVWQSKLRIELPHLGAVSAMLQLQGNHLRVQLLAASEDSAALLKDKSASLAEALEAAGSALDQITVKQDEHA